MGGDRRSGAGVPRHEPVAVALPRVRLAVGVRRRLLGELATMKDAMQEVLVLQEVLDVLREVLAHMPKRAVKSRALIERTLAKHAKHKDVASEGALLAAVKRLYDAAVMRAITPEGIAAEDKVHGEALIDLFRLAGCIKTAATRDVVADSRTCPRCTRIDCEFQRAIVAGRLLASSIGSPEHQDCEAAAAKLPRDA